MQDGVGGEHTQDDEGTGHSHSHVLRWVGQEHVRVHSGSKGQEAADTCAHVDSEGDDHGSCHHAAPGLQLGPPHAVEDGYAAHVTLKSEADGGHGVEHGYPGSWPVQGVCWGHLFIRPDVFDNNDGSHIPGAHDAQEAGIFLEADLPGYGKGQDEEAGSEADGELAVCVPGAAAGPLRLLCHHSYNLVLLVPDDDEEGDAGPERVGSNGDLTQHACQLATHSPHHLLVGPLIAGLGAVGQDDEATDDENQHGHLQRDASCHAPSSAEGCREVE